MTSSQLLGKTSEERGGGSGLLSQWMFLPAGKAGAHIKTRHWSLGWQLGGKPAQWSQRIWEMTFMVSEETFSQSSLVASCLLEQWAMLIPFQRDMEIWRGTREGSQELETSSYEKKKKKTYKNLGLYHPEITKLRKDLMTISNRWRLSRERSKESQNFWIEENRIPSLCRRENSGLKKWLALSLRVTSGRFRANSQVSWFQIVFFQQNRRKSSSASSSKTEENHLQLDQGAKEEMGARSKQKQF